MTAVEWLIDKLEIFATEEEMNIIEQAKEMEKEQIIRAYLMARCYDNENSVTEAEQYYNETFNKQ